MLKPRAPLILTLDNAANPLIAIRNALPFAMLKRSGVVPYFVGARLRTDTPQAGSRLSRI